MKTLLLLLITLLSFNLFGQISGKVNSVKAEAIPFANVILLSAKDSSIVIGTTTDENGDFQISPNKTGEFCLRISSIGYQNYQSEPFAFNNTPIQINPIFLAEENNALNEVTVSAKKELIQNTPTGKIINIQSSLLTKGYLALYQIDATISLV